MRPSDERRRTLAEGITLPAVSNFFPIARYYDAADVLYESIILTQSDASRLDLCYVYGKRYCRFVLEAIPTHNYYGLPTYRSEKMKHASQVEKVVTILERVAMQMDEEEIQRQKAIELENEKRLQEWQWQQIRMQQQQQNGGTKIDVASSALDKLKRLQGITDEPIVAVGIPVAVPPPARPSSTRFRLDDSSDEDDDHNNKVNGMAVNPNGLPPPLLPPSSTLLPPVPLLPPAPPPYAAVVGKYHPLKVSQPLAPIDTNKQLTQRSLTEIKRMYGRLYQQYIQDGRIVVSSLETYQGRKSASTNGCTVISALCAAAHLNQSENIADTSINRIIDDICGPVLSTIRGKLGLGGHALIIPSDVHDHLVDRNILRQEKFRGAAGGNVLDPAHYGEFLKLLTDEPSSKVPPNGNHRPTKAGATFFFREHVISIVKCVYQDTITYDFIDSMPAASWQGRATRTSCRDVDALTTQLLHYVSHKLPDTSAMSAPWDDGMADLDPRVFQGFVWGD
jgi:hypothetical protein